MDGLSLKFESDFSSFRNLILNHLGVDVFSKIRKREIVEGRFIYSKLLYEAGYTFKSIGRALGKDHSTVIYYRQQFEDLYITEKEFRMKHNLIKEVLTESDEIEFVKKVTRAEYKEQVVFLEKKLEALILRNTKLETIENRYRRFDEIIQLMEAKLPVGKEIFLLKKLNSILNTEEPT
jgi:hypothetical protein